MKNDINSALGTKKKNYIQPAWEAVMLNTAFGVCQTVSKNAELSNGGGTETIEPGHGL